MAKDDDLKKREKALADREKALDDREEKIIVKEKTLAKKEKDLDNQKKALDEKERATMAEFISVDEIEEEPELTKKELALVGEGCDAYGIDPKYVLKARIDKVTGEAVILTAGGASVRFSKDMKNIVPLDAVRVDGIVRKRMRPLTGNKKK